MESLLNPLEPVTRDVQKAAANLGRDEARFLVDMYYSMQDFRMSSSNQVRSILQGDTDEPFGTLSFFSEQFYQLEKEIAKSLDYYSRASSLGRWARANYGVGPVISAGLLAYIDIERAPYASSLWRYAGLCPGQKLQKGVKRDWNAKLKVLCWKLGDSFVKFSGRDECYYGKLYRERKALEVARNDAGANAETAKVILASRNFKSVEAKTTYESGKLPDGQIDARSRRYAVKRFLVHYFEAAWVDHYGTEPPNPYVQDHLGHIHIDSAPVPFTKSQFRS